MKILFYISTIRGGGAARVMVNLANALVDEHEVFLITNFPSEHEYKLKKSVKMFRLEETEPHKNRVLKNIERLSSLRKIIKRTQPDVSVAFMRENNFRLIISTMGLKTKTVISVRNDPQKEYNSFFSQKLAEILFRKADGVVFQTEDAKNFFSDSIQSKSKIIFNQVDSKFFQKSDTIGQKIIACGRLSKQKNYHMMIDAFQIVLEKFPEEKLYIYGDGALEAELKTYVMEKGMSSSVFLMGFSENLVEIYSDAKLFLLTSDYEGMPNVMLEALASSVPVICTDCPCGGPKSVIRHGKNGLLCPVGNTEAFAEAMVEVLKDTEKLKLMRQNAYVSAQVFSADKVLEAWCDFLGVK